MIDQWDPRRCREIRFLRRDDELVPGGRDAKPRIDYGEGDRRSRDVVAEVEVGGRAWHLREVLGELAPADAFFERGTGVPDFIRRRGAVGHPSMIREFP